MSGRREKKSEEVSVKEQVQVSNKSTALRVAEKEREGREQTLVTETQM